MIGKLCSRILLSFLIFIISSRLNLKREGTLYDNDMWCNLKLSK